MGVPIYCSRVCSGLARRVERTDEQKKKIKAEYYNLYRRTEKSKETKRKYNQTPSGRATQKRNREKQKDNHRKYIQKDEYRKAHLSKRATTNPITTPKAKNAHHLKKGFGAWIIFSTVTGTFI